MRRRGYLSLVAVFLAGCGSQDTGAETTEPPATTDAPTVTATATATPTATPEQAPDDPLEAFEFWLTGAFEAYVPAGETFVDVNGAVAETDLETARSNLEEADAVRSELEDASLGGDRQSRVDDLTGTYHFLGRIVSVQAELRTAWEAHRDGWNAVLSQEGGLGEAQSTVRSAADAARADYNNLVAESDAGDMNSFPPLLVSDYETKLGRFDAAISAYLDLMDTFDDFGTAMGRADRGFAHYGNESFTQASVAFDEGADQFETLAEEFSGGWPDHFDTTTEDAQCVSTAMQRGCRRLADVAQAVAEGNESDPEAAKASTRSRFESCELVFDNVSIVQDFYE